MPRVRSSPDIFLVIVTLMLVTVGCLMVYSASSVSAEYRFDDAYFFVKRQLIFVALGFVSMFLMTQIDYWRWRDLSKAALWVCFLLLLIVLIPGVGLVRGGAQSWLGIGAFSIQPSEFMKLAMILFLASYISVNQKFIVTWKKGLIPTLALLFLAFGLIMLQPDLGTGAVMILTSVLMIFIAGARISHFVILGCIGIVGFIGLIASAPYRIQRITSFLNPWEDPLGGGFQIIQSLYAIAPGGLLGLGFGESRQKYFYLPEPQTDFIFAILTEELGFIGGGFVLICFAVLLWRGIRIALYAPDLFGTLFAAGITAMIAFQVMINVSVVIGLMPVTGITLPLMSYGGSSLTIMLTTIGILLNISRHTPA
ncbi:stage V sporulation protein E [Salipaludibacillus neizhouensis]|uniref:Stage V sporulation protein E n=1 Tax=Salipaludibacillus neizhouensis TaxID=885475 RepID=A0A3A9K9P0_9BACI|nr:stage V sporulation protein E [Salipaludibacillus neizhouensis]RKL68909.1 stage V sporulation protein E [Salipaludibacillus neizhouensis]